MKRFFGLALAVLIIASCSSSDAGNGEEPTTDEGETLTTDFDPVAAIQQATPYRCTEKLAFALSRVLDSGNVDLLLTTFGTRGPAYQAMRAIYMEVYPKQYTDGLERAANALPTRAANACMDADVANDVLLLEPGDEGFMTYCLDGNVALTFETAPSCAMDDGP